MNGRSVLFAVALITMAACGTRSTGTTTPSSTPRVSPSPSEIGVPGTPGGRLGASMAWDERNGYLLMFGGARFSSSGNIPYNDTWIWTGNEWRQLQPTVSPPGRTFPAMAFDKDSQRVLLFGGGAANSDPSRNDTWAWDGTTWTELHPTTTPPLRAEARMVYDPDLPGIVLVSQASPGDAGYVTTWTWTGSNLSQLNPATS